MILIRETTFFAFGFQGEACTEIFFSSGLQTGNSGDLTTTGNFEYCFFDPVGEFSGDDKNIRKSSGLCGIWRDSRSAEKLQMN